MRRTDCLRCAFARTVVNSRGKMKEEKGKKGKGRERGKERGEERRREEEGKRKKEEKKRKTGSHHRQSQTQFSPTFRVLYAALPTAGATWGGRA